MCEKRIYKNTRLKAGIGLFGINLCVRAIFL